MKERERERTESKEERENSAILELENLKLLMKVFKKFFSMFLNCCIH